MSSKSEWRVSSNIINGRTMYIAYRLRDANGVDHSGNREYIGYNEYSNYSETPGYRGGYTEDLASVERIVAELNKVLPLFE